MYPFVSLNQSDNHSQIFVGHKLSCQFGLWPGISEDVELKDGIQGNFKDDDITIKSLKFPTRNARKVYQWPRCVPFSGNRVRKLESFGLWMSDNKVVKKRDKTKH